MNMFWKKWFFADHYSIIVIPKDKSRVRRLQVKRRSLFSFLLLVIFASSFTTLSVVGLFHFRDESLATKEIREKGYIYEQQRQQVISQLEELDQMMAEIEDLADKLEKVAGISKETNLVGLNSDVIANKKGFQPAALDLSEWKKEFEVFDDAALRATYLKSVDLQEKTKVGKKRLEKLLNFNREADYFWKSLPTVWPVEGWISSDFGMRRSPLSGKWQHHAGIDIAGPKGTPIKATGDGVVTFTGRYGGFGKMVIIDHGYGIATLYGHNSDILVKEGDSIKRGDFLARRGNSGRSTGPHLHYEVLEDGVPVNPLQYVLE